MQSDLTADLKSKLIELEYNNLKEALNSDRVQEKW